MMALANLTWENTNNALNELESHLDCGVCGKLVSTPCTLGGCEHFFCRACLEGVAGEACPVCSMPSHVRDVQSNRQLTTAVSLCRRLARLLNSTPDVAPDLEDPPTEEETVAPVSPPAQLTPPSLSPSHSGASSRTIPQPSPEKKRVKGVKVKASLKPQPSSSSIAKSSSFTTLSSETGLESGIPKPQPSSSVSTSEISTSASSSPPLRRTRRVAKIERKQERLRESNSKWGIGEGNEQTDKCLTCTRTRTENKVTFLSDEEIVQQPDFNKCDEHKNRDSEEPMDVDEPQGPKRKTKTVVKVKERKDTAKENTSIKEDNQDHMADNTVLESSKNLTEIARKNTRKSKAKSVEQDEPIDSEEKTLEKVQSPQSNQENNQTSDSPNDGSTKGVKRKIRGQKSDSSHTHIKAAKSKALSTNSGSKAESTVSSNKATSSTVSSNKATSSTVSSNKATSSTVSSNKATSSTVSSNKATSSTVSSNKSPMLTPNSTLRNTPNTNSGKNPGKFSRRSVNSPATQPWISPAHTISPALATPSGRTRRSLSPRGGASPMTGTPVAKKNVKGETPLHIACIKGDHDAVLALLQEGAAINAKDNAGWTPLHEACNHGHTTIVSTLLDHHALVNVPGLDHDTPLHDAVRNDRSACVRLLLQRGASRNARNARGEVPADLAMTDEMREALETEVDETLLQPSQMVHVEPPEIVLLATGLDREQKAQLQKFSALLHCQLHTEFTEKVTHVVSWVNKEGQCIRTSKYLQAILTGKWIVNFHWVETCLEYGQRVSEEAFEVPGARTAPDSLAPAAARHNVCMQRPGLFSGCHFYLSGHFPASVRSDVELLLRLGGAVLLCREPRPEYCLLRAHAEVPYHARAESSLRRCSHFVLHGEKEGKEGGGMRVEAEGRLCHVNTAWLMDSIAHFKLLDV